jgi:hypothetical protein
MVGFRTTVPAVTGAVQPALAPDTGAVVELVLAAATSLVAVLLLADDELP